jgi:hypothetical protein
MTANPEFRISLSAECRYRRAVISGVGIAQPSSSPSNAEQITENR